MKHPERIEDYLEHIAEAIALGIAALTVFLQKVIEQFLTEMKVSA